MSGCAAPRSRCQHRSQRRAAAPVERIVAGASALTHGLRDRIPCQQGLSGEHPPRVARHLDQRDRHLLPLLPFVFQNMVTMYVHGAELCVPQKGSVSRDRRGWGRSASRYLAVTPCVLGVTCCLLSPGCPWHAGGPAWQAMLGCPWPGGHP